LLDQHKPSHVVLELGGNDGLRGLDPQAMQANLMRMGQQVKQRGAQLIVVGIRIPPNYGRAYQLRFDSAFQQVAKELNAPLVGSLLEGIEADRSAFQPDGIHPTAAVQTQLLDNVWPALKKTLK
jgi:acyl-CoA thioesterase-1